MTLIGLTGWAVWQGIPDGAPTAPRHHASASHRARVEPPRIAYVRSGVLYRPGFPPTTLPAGAWTDFVELSDGEVVLIGKGSLAVLDSVGELRTYPRTGGVNVPADRAAVAWTGPHGRVRVLLAGRAKPAVAPRSVRLGHPACLGPRLVGQQEPANPSLFQWRSCDRYGNVLSPDHRYVAWRGEDGLTVAPRSSVTPAHPHGVGKTTYGVGQAGPDGDLVWEDPSHLLVLDRDAVYQPYVFRTGLNGDAAPLIPPTPGGDRRHPALMLPLIGDAG
ncbi:hypothetical protein [Nocardioides panacihumi]|uniref:hypothetical protein n=1 Tax=Nocardioides panacihumi TaxID=400774 RepID=UPI0031CFE092